MAREQKGNKPANEPGADRGERVTATHRWAIDRIEEGTAAVEQDGDHVYEIPRYLVPADARDGDVLVVSVTSNVGGEASISVRIDRAAGSASAVKGSARKRRGGNDPGGDVVL